MDKKSAGRVKLRRIIHEMLDTVVFMIKTLLDPWFIVCIIFMKMYNVLKIFFGDFYIFKKNHAESAQIRSHI